MLAMARASAALIEEPMPLPEMGQAETLDGRTAAVARALGSFDDGTFERHLARRVAVPTESQNPERSAEMLAYYTEDIGPALEALGYEWTIRDNPADSRLPFLVARRLEDHRAPTVLTYGHADVVPGLAGWGAGRSPWQTTAEDGRIYGRGTADNKGQHTICLLALESILAVRGTLGFNSVILFESGEEVGSPGLHDFCRNNAAILRADVLIASDGPRFQRETPTVLLGTRGVLNFALKVALRDSGHHSGTHGGLLASASIILANAIASIVDRHGAISVPEWRPHIPDSVRAALADLRFDAGQQIDSEWGEPGLTAAERLMAWNSFEVLAFSAGNPSEPVNAIPPRAIAQCSLRYVVGTAPEIILPALRRHLDSEGFGNVEIIPDTKPAYRATRLDPADPLARWAAASVRATTGREPIVIPNAGGTLPNDAFAIDLETPTIWVPHSYADCRQHAPDEHLLVPLAREGLAIMTGLFWDASGLPTRSGRTEFRR